MSIESGRVVIITGGARGIGYGIASCFARQGAKIVIADVNRERAVQAAEKLRRLGARDAVGVPCDITDRTQIQRVVDETIARFGQIDVLVNSAGICPFVDVMELTAQTWSRTIDVEHPERYLILHLAAPAGYHAPELRLVLGYPEDHQLINEIFRRLEPKYGEAFSTPEILDLVAADPKLAQINRHCVEKPVR